MKQIMKKLNETKDDECLFISQQNNQHLLQYRLDFLNEEFNILTDVIDEDEIRFLNRLVTIN